MFVNHQRSDKEKRKKREDKTQDEGLSARDQWLRIQFVPIDVIPVEGWQEDPIAELEFGLLCLWHLIRMRFIDSYLSTLFYKLFDGFQVF